MLLSTAYFPPVSWFAAAAESFSLSPEGSSRPLVYLEACENYQKQSYRNRCRFFSANGVESLNVPVIHENGTFKRPIRLIKVDYSLPWVLKTKRAISSAYESSPFFEYYKDDVFNIIEAGHETLWELNLSLIEFFFKKLGIEAVIRFTETYVKEGEDTYGKDYRSLIHPKKKNSILQDLNIEKPYFQVFSRKYGFQSDLSIMDLLFCEGPYSIAFLK